MFRDALKQWRIRSGLGQMELDAAIGKNRGFVNHLENGVTKPPERAVCFAIGAALGVSGEVVWDAARDERLQGFDLDLYRHYVGGDRGRPCAVGAEPTPTEDEHDLLETLRWLDEAVGNAAHTPLAEHLMDAALTLLVDTSIGEKRPSHLAHDVVGRIRRFEELPDDKQRAVLRTFVAAMDAALPNLAKKGSGQGRGGPAKPARKRHHPSDIALPHRRTK